MVGGATGLIPSQFLEEKRKAFVPRDFDGSGMLVCGFFPAVLITELWINTVNCALVTAKNIQKFPVSLFSNADDEKTD